MESDEPTYEKLMRSECMIMKENRMCGKLKMECDGNTCWHTPTFKRNYVWRDSKIEVEYECQINKTYLIDPTESS